MNRQTVPDQSGITVATAELLVSYPGRQFSRARGEIIRTLRGFGDPAPRVVKTSVWGIALVMTSLENREVIRRCHALYRADPAANFRFALKWVPVDHWTRTSLPAIRELIAQRVVPLMGAGETWALRVQKRRWERYHTRDIIIELAHAVPHKVDLTHPDWLLWVDVVGNRTAVSLLRPQDIFSVLQAQRG